jgi:putative ABC transport system permease protein
MSEIFGISANTLLIILGCFTALILVFVGLMALRNPLAFRLGIRNLPRRKGQTLLVIGGLALSTMIITSALGIGDTIDYSTKSGVFKDLGAVDLRLGTDRIEASSGISFNAGPVSQETQDNWFNESASLQAAALIDGQTLDGSVPVIIQRLPVANSNTNLSEASVEIRGIGSITGEGLAEPQGLNYLNEGQALVNQALAVALNISTGDELLLIKGTPYLLSVAGIVPDGELAGSSAAVLLSLGEAQRFFQQPGMINGLLISIAGNAERGVRLNDQAVAALTPLAEENGLMISQIKLKELDAAASSAEFITTLFITFGTFSIFSGILLIFLIFTVLAAERQSEMGISRAVGLQRRDLVQQFVTEGLAYNMIAAAIGAALGVGAALLLAGTVLSLLVDSADLNIVARVTPRSAAIGFLLGLVITFLTVTLSALRISQVNIIAAIRNLNIPKLPRPSQWTLFLHPLRTWRDAIKAAGQRNWGKAIKLFLFSGPRAVLNFWLGLLARGPVLMALGFAFAWIGVNLAEMSGVYGMGVALFFIGLGQLAAWFGLSKRLSYSLIGLALILYWSLPTREIGALAELNSNPGDFFISGMFLVGGAILLFLYNAESLLTLFAGLISRLGKLLPVARVSIAYPVAAKGRTATTLAMFSLIIFTLVGTATISNTFSNFLDVESGSGGYDIQIQMNPFNPVPADEFLAQLDSKVADGSIDPMTAVAGMVSAPVQAQSPDMSGEANYVINGIDDSFFDTQQLKLSAKAKGYESETQVWEALRNNPNLVVVDNFSVDRSGDPTYTRSEDSFIITSIASTEDQFDPVQINITGKDGQQQQFTVIAVINSAPAFYGAMMNLEAASQLGYTEPGRYFVRTSQGEARSVANKIESSFSRSGVQTTLLKEQLAQSRSSVNSIFYLLQGFMGLGLLIGISALGVVTIRSVVERRQQIGVLRAIGFQRNMVQGIFLLENMFVAGLGTLIGYGLALTFSYNLYLQVAADQGLDFLPPWLTLSLIAVSVIATALFTAWLHARQGARVVIAEALRYQG